MGKVLITRPEPQATILSNYLIKYGYKSIIHPMLEIEQADFNLKSLAKYEALIFTSTNAVRAFVSCNDTRDVDVYCVGQRTQSIVQEHGFENVHSCFETVSDLIEVFKSKQLSKSLLYVRGDQITVDIKAELTDIQIDEIIAYYSHKKTKLNDETANSLMGGEISDVLFYSQRTVASFYEAVLNHKQSEKIIESLTRTRALFLSDSMIKYASEISREHGLNIQWKTVLSPNMPTNNALVDLLKL